VIVAIAAVVRQSKRGTRYLFGLSPAIWLMDTVYSAGHAVKRWRSAPPFSGRDEAFRTMTLPDSRVR
jgi:hypothetical protein